MDSITLKLTKEQSELVQELLEKALNKQSAVISDVLSTTHEVKRAKFVCEYIKLLQQALQQGYTAINGPGSIMIPVLGELKTMLESQMAIMKDLMQDDSLLQDNLEQVTMRAIELWGIMHRMTYEALQIEKEAA